ncbi:WGR domain-containing protein [Thioclava atlantica]|uniref:WGR domain-containing protein n=1 Tax=Thioclava atlantica TaxID=1317124 RepID=A0A085TVT9_9RHOB|nr:WGR domain-containing protein [Thioclava atlantica]KFE34836.1 WGR domain-containing protein [Thioclava atlantica]
MLNLILHRPGARRFYRVEVSDNLFGEYTVLREWGIRGHDGRQCLRWFSNLRDAVAAAETFRRKAQRRGYCLSEALAAQGLRRAPR